MRPRYWIPAAGLLAAGLVLYFAVYGYDFAGVLVCLLAAAFLVFGLVDSGRRRFPKAMHCLHRVLWVLAALGLAVALGTGIWIAASTGGAAQPQADYVIVLGAGVDGDTPSQSLRERLSAAQRYLETYPEAIAILSGGRGSGESVTEARCMYDWLTARGIDPDRLRMEEQAASTQENLEFSLNLIQAETGVRPETVAVISSEYHLCRASLLAKRAGVQMLGYPARTENRVFFCNMLIREICGVWATLLFG